VFGAGPAAELMRSPVRTWSGPLTSPYGVHLVWSETREPAESPPFESVRGRVLERWREERRAERLAQLIRDLKARSLLNVDSAVWRERRDV